MKIAIIGKGTAGSIAAAYLKNHLKSIEIDLYYSDDIATIGVGEGGGPRLANFLDRISVDHQVFCQKTQATRKWGILFENWGSRPNQTIHHFHPARERYSFHFDASQLHELVLDKQQTNIIEGNVQSINKAGNDLSLPSITFHDREIFYDYIIDATGFIHKKQNEADKTNPETIPNNSLLLANRAYLVQTKSGGMGPFQYTILNHLYDSLTLSKALRHGWMFVIPLKHRVSYGYIHNDNLSELDLVQEELHYEINKIDPAHSVISSRTLSFQSFTNSKFLDQCIFSIGNRAAFAEPLEATAIEFILRECSEICELLSPQSIYADSNRDLQQVLFNSRLNDEMQRIALFIGWHYSNGSIYKSDFWCQSKEHYQYMRKNLIDTKIVSEFDNWLSTLNYTNSCPDKPFFGWSFRSFEEVSSAII